jgi:hypothetical protein
MWAPLGQKGLPEFDPSILRTTAQLSSDDIESDDEGNFSIALSPNEVSGNWLEIGPETVCVIVRIVHHRRAEEVDPTFTIDRIDEAVPRPVRPDDISAGLAKAAQTVLGFIDQTRAWWLDRFGARPNELTFSSELYLKYGGVPDRHFAFGAWHKPDGKALLIEFTPPECDYWNFQLCNIWQENLDNYEDGEGFVTKYTAATEPGGVVRIVVADNDPGLGGNLVNPFQHTRGLMGLRIIKALEPPAVTIRLVPA